MVQVVGTITDSSKRVLSKIRLSITLVSSIVDIAPDPDVTLLPITSRFVITDGALASAQFVKPDGTLDTAAPIDLLPTTVFGTQYYFVTEQVKDRPKFYTQDGELYSQLQDDGTYSAPVWQWTTGSYTPPGGSLTTPDSQWYTGQSPRNPDQKLLTRIVTTEFVRIDDFYSGINAGTTAEYSLLRKSGLTSTLDDSLYLVLESLTTNPTYVNRISGKLNVRGMYDPAVFYVKNDVVVSGTILAVYINNSSTAGNAPPNNSGAADTAFWAKLPNLTVNPANQDLSNYLLKAGGVMTGALLLPAWGVTPDSATAVRIADGDLRYAMLTTNQTIAGVKTFSSSPVVPDLAVGTNNTNAVNAKQIIESCRDQVVGLGVSGVGGTTPANRIVQTDPNAATPPTIFWAAESDTLNLFDPATGIFTTPAGGAATYRVSCTLELQATGNFTGFARLWLYTLGTAGAPVVNGFRIDERYCEMVNTNTVILRGEYRFTLSASERFSVRVSASAANLVVNTNNNNQLTVRRAF